jgi:hypothetical protein
MPNPSRRPPSRALSLSGTEQVPKAPPPPPKGNQRNLVHGAHAEPPADAVAEAYEAIARAVPLRADGQLPVADETAAWLLARTLVRLRSVGAWLDKNGALDRRGKPRSALRAENKLSNQAMAYARELGLTPRSRAQIGASLVATVDVVAALSEPNPERRALLLARAGVGGPDDV